MPPENFRSISLKKYAVKKLTAKYLNNKDSLAAKGINSISGYFTHIAEKEVDESKSLRSIAEKITKTLDFIKIPKEYFPLDF